MKGKKLLAGIISAAMVLSMGIASVSAATTVAKIGTTSYTSLEDAIAAAAASATITLTSDVSIDKTLEIDKTIKLNLSAYTITNNSQGEAICVTNGTTTVSASTGGITSPNGKQCFVIKGDSTKTTAAKLTVNGGTYDSGEANEAISFSYDAPASSQLKFGKNLVNSKAVYANIIGGINLDTNIKHSSTTISGATITSSCYNTINAGKSALTIDTKATINSKGKYAIYASTGSTVDVQQVYMYLYGDSGLYADGGIIGMNHSSSELYVEGTNTKYIFSTGNGGAINLTKGVFYMNNGSYLFDNGVNITRGTFHLENASNVFADNVGKIISGGTFIGSAETIAAINEHTAEGSTITTKSVAAKIGNTTYATLADAVEAVNKGDTIELLCDASGDGIVVPSGSEFTIDFGGHTYNVDGTTVGSPDTQTNGFQLLKDSTLTFKNGKITSEKALKLIQNYSNLTLEDMDLSLNNIDQEGRTLYTLSNNNGTTVITGNTNISALEGNVAFDIFSGWTTAYPSVSVILDDNMTGAINGDIEIGNWDQTVVDLTLKIKNGTVNGNIIDNRSDAEKTENPKIDIISGGTFSTDVSEYCEDGFIAEKDETTGQYVIKKALTWETDTDSGYYMDGDTKYGMMRFMFKTAPTGTVTGSGIKYINANDISKSVTAETASGATTFQGDVVKVPTDTTGTYYARAYITTDEGTFWSEPVGCSVNWNQFFTNYTGGAQ